MVWFTQPLVNYIGSVSSSRYGLSTRGPLITGVVSTDSQRATFSRPAFAFSASNKVVVRSCPSNASSTPSLPSYTGCGGFETKRNSDAINDSRYLVVQEATHPNVYLPVVHVALPSKFKLVQASREGIVREVFFQHWHSALSSS